MISPHPLLKLVHHSIDRFSHLIWEERYLIDGYDRSKILIRVYTSVGGYVTVQYIINVGMTDRRRKRVENRQIIFKQTGNYNPDAAYIALNNFVASFVGETVSINEV